MIDAAWQNLTFTDDPIASSLIGSARGRRSPSACSTGRNLDGIYDLSSSTRCWPPTASPRSSTAVTDHHPRARGLARQPQQRTGPAATAGGLERVCKRFGSGDNGGPRPRRHLPRGPGRRVRLPGRRVGLRQDHPAQPGGRARPPDRRRGRRQRQGRADVPGVGAVPVAHRWAERGAGPAAAGRAPQGAPDPGAPSCSSSCTSTASPTSAPRAVGWHAPAGRPGPGARPGRRRAAHGRAVRRARRHDPRRLHDELERIWQETGLTVLFVTHNVREAAARPTASCSSPAGPAGWRRSSRSTSPGPRRIESPDVSALAAEITARLREEVARHGRR